jgi:hypothetical protein
MPAVSENRTRRVFQPERLCGMLSIVHLHSGTGTTKSFGIDSVTEVVKSSVLLSEATDFNGIAAI